MNNSTLKAVGRTPASGVYQVMFYYELPEGGKDVTKPEIMVPALDWDHMQATVRAFNKID